MGKQLRTNGRAIAAIRVRERLTQRALAGKADCSAGLIARIETGDTDCSEELVIRLADALGVEPAAISNPVPEEVA